jgi:hypothetical protein
VTTTSVVASASAGQRAGRRGLASFAGTTVGALAAAAALATVDPNESGHYPGCPFLAVTGYYCPGCGTLRAVHDGLHGDLHGALARNPLTVVLAPLVLLAWVCWGLRLAGYDAPHPTRLPVGWIWALLGVVLAYWVLRNVPGWSWLSPA